MAAKGREGTIVWEGETGAILCYPTEFKAQLVSVPHGSLKISKGENFDSSDTIAHKRSHRKRKRERILNHGERLQRQHFIQVRDSLLKCYHSLISIGQELKYFTVGCPKTRQVSKERMVVRSETMTSVEPKDILAVANLKGAPGTDRIDFCALCNLDSLGALDEGPAQVINITHDSKDDVDVFGRVVCNTSADELSLSCLQTQFSLPPHSTFLLSDISRLSLLTNYTAERKMDYNLVVIDPPWENRSVIRGKNYILNSHWLDPHLFPSSLAVSMTQPVFKYQWLDDEQLKALPVRELAAPRALVVVWVTNKRRLAQLVKESLFPAWDIRFEGEWTWLKVTTQGEFVFDLDSEHKKPYETLVIGRMQSSSASHLNDSTCLSVGGNDHKSTYSEGESAPLSAIGKTTPLPAICETTRLSAIGESVPLSAIGESVPLSAIGESVPLSAIGESTPLSPIGESAPLSPIGESAPLSPIGESAPLSAIRESAPLSAIGESTVGSHLVSARHEALGEEEMRPIKTRKAEGVKCCTFDSAACDNTETGMVGFPASCAFPKSCLERVSVQGARPHGTFIPESWVFLCIPSIIHSQKPYLGDLLSKYVDGDVRGIELFARNLLPGWMSWGNEVLKYQMCSTGRGAKKNSLS